MKTNPTYATMLRPSPAELRELENTGYAMISKATTPVFKAWCEGRHIPELATELNRTHKSVHRTVYRAYTRWRAWQKQIIKQKQSAADAVWLKTHAHEYQGWVALQDGKLLDNAPTRAALVQRLRDEDRLSGVFLVCLTVQEANRCDKCGLTSPCSPDRVCPVGDPKNELSTARKTE